MKKSKRKKQLETDEWNERSINREEDKTRKEDKEWDKQNEDDEERGGNEDEFHEGDYDT
jgi:hypothetical protein